VKLHVSIAVMLLVMVCGGSLFASQSDSMQISRVSFKDQLENIEKGETEKGEIYKTITSNLMSNMRTMGYTGIFTMAGGSVFGSISLGLLFGNTAGAYIANVLMMSAILGSIGGLAFTAGIILAIVGFAVIARNMRGSEERRTMLPESGYQTVPELAVSFSISGRRNKSGRQ
jgi:hypothetical protein